MEFIKLDIYTGGTALEPLMSRLEDLGASGFEIHDAEDFEQFLQSDIKHWDYVGEELDPLKTQETHLTIYLTKDSQGEQICVNIRKEFSNLRIEQGSVREEDWADNWKQYFKPFPIGEKLLIKPTWEDIPEDLQGRKILEIDPASAFGTGQHESTKLCLEALEQEITQDCTVLDLGCGSGILSIASLLLGAKSAAMTDISENAVRVACENMEQNGFFKDNYTAFCGDITENEGLLKKIGSNFDIITANIVADVIIKLSGIFPRLLKNSGVLITSGIIEERCDEVKAALEGAGLKIKSTENDNGWCLITAGN